MMMLTILLSIGLTAQSAEDNVEMGPFDVSFEINDPKGYNVEIEDPVAFDKFTGYPFSIESLATYKATDVDIELSDAFIWVKVQDYAEVVDVSFDGLCQELDDAYAWYWKDFKIDYRDFTIGGMPGMLGTVQPEKLSDDNYLDRPVYLAAYSPDGRGMSGHVIVFIQSSYPWEVTEPFLRSLKVSRDN